MAVRKIDLDQIRVLDEFQAREKMSRKLVDEYAELAQEGTQFPPLQGIDVGGDVILTDGFHRYHAYKKLQFLDADMDITEGTRADAFLAAARANTAHGMRRTPGDAVKAARIAILGLVEQNGRRKRPTTEAVRELTGVGSSTVTLAYEQLDAEGVNVGPKDKRGRKKGSSEYDYETGGEEATEDESGEVPTPAVMVSRQAAGLRKELDKVMEHAQARLTNLDAATLSDPSGDAHAAWMSVAEAASQLATLIYNRIAEAGQEISGGEELPEEPTEEGGTFEEEEEPTSAEDEPTEDTEAPF